MDVTFRTNALRACYEREDKAISLWGPKIGRQYRKRINDLYAATDHRTLYALRHLRFHELGGDRKGQYAINLDNAWRLIVTFGNAQFTVVRVEEVTDHYGD
jgi:proteic killer suppression protein